MGRRRSRGKFFQRRGKERRWCERDIIERGKGEEASPGLWGLPKRGLVGSFRSHVETTAIEIPVTVLGGGSKNRA